MDREKQTGLPVDGNAAAGLLREFFAFDVTAADVTCRGCGVVATIGDIRVYGGAMGAIFRCASCDHVVIRLSRTASGFWLDTQGARSLFVRRPEE